jgi:hypothetical protein
MPIRNQKRTGASAHVAVGSYRTNSAKLTQAEAATREGARAAQAAAAALGSRRVRK